MAVPMAEIYVTAVDRGDFMPVHDPEVDVAARC